MTPEQLQALTHYLDARIYEMTRQPQLPEPHSLEAKARTRSFRNLLAAFGISEDEWREFLQSKR